MYFSIVLSLQSNRESFSLYGFTNLKISISSALSKEKSILCFWNLEFKKGISNVKPLKVICLLNEEISLIKASRSSFSSSSFKAKNCFIMVLLHSL